MPKLAAGALFLAMLLSAWPGWAQERRRPQAPEGPAEGTQVPPELAIADLKVGPFYLQPRGTLRDLGWDNNVTGKPDGPSKTSDFRATPGGGLKIALPIRQRHLLTGDGQVDYLWYKDTRALRTFNAAALAQYAFTSETFEVDLTNRYVDAQRTQTGIIRIGEEPVDPDFEIFEAARQRTNLSSFRGAWYPSTRLMLEGRASRRVVRFKDLESGAMGLSDQLDRTEETVGGTAALQVTANARLGLVVDWTNYDYENENNFRGAETYRAGARLELEPSAPLNGTLIIGYRDLAPRLAGVLGFEGVVIDGAIGLQPGGMLAIEMAGMRDALPSFFGSNVYYVRQGGGISVLAQAVRALALGADASLHEHTYPVPSFGTQNDGSNILATRLDRIYQFSGQLRWNVSTWTAVGVRVGWVNRTSNFDAFEVDGLVISSTYAVTY